MNTTIDFAWHDRMPASARTRLVAPRVLPAGAVAAQDTCALIVVAGSGYRAVITDATSAHAFSTNALPGTSAWSPPI